MGTRARRRRRPAYRASRLNDNSFDDRRNCPGPRLANTRTRISLVVGHGNLQNKGPGHTTNVPESLKTNSQIARYSSCREGHLRSTW
jgi:hypothetical protein